MIETTETTEDIVDELADLAGIYGIHEEGEQYQCRRCWAAKLRQRMTEAVVSELKRSPLSSADFTAEVSDAV